ncbi:UNVERIFIED_CONTAM: purine nucleoside phosphorylase [Streptomyces canus]
MANAEIGVIGGSGFYSFLDDVTEVQVDTPYGPPSDSLFLGEVAGRRVAFLPRHGRGHHLPPHRINYRANLWALRSVGARQVLGPCAVGGLRPEYGPGTLLVPDQLVDRTKSRAGTYFDGLPLPDGGVPNVVHVSLADPYCPVGPGGRAEGGSRPGLGGGGRRHARRDRGAAVLDPRRVVVAPGPGLVGGGHDRPPRGGARP